MSDKPDNTDWSLGGIGRIKKNTNYGLVKSWREIIRGKYDSK
jgi:hypothetical protein